MKNLKNILISVSLLFLISGCSVMMPYEESFSCNENMKKGSCSSATDNYYKSKSLNRKGTYAQFLEKTGAINSYNASGNSYQKVIILKDGTILKK